jgi:hypothetical protein
MKMKTHKIKLLLAICAAGGISAASAQTTNIIFGTDFEGNGNYTVAYGYAYAGGNLGGSPTAFVGGITAGVGVTNSSAFDSMPDFTATGSDPNYTNSASYTYSGTEAPLQFGAPITPMVPTANVDSYVLSFDAMVQGLLPGVNTTTVYFNEFDIQTNYVTAIKLTGGAFTVGSNFVHFDVPLSQLTVASGSLSDLTNSDELASVTGFVADFRVSDERGTLQVNRSPVWGFDNDNQLIIDNIYLSQSSSLIPPPIYERLIWELNFDDKSTTDTYGFVFRDGQNFATTTAAINPTDGVGGSAGFQVTADISSWATNPPTAYSGFGGGAGAANPYTLSNTNKSGYRVYWTAKVGGLLDGVEEAPGNASIQFLVPPGTLTPSNSGESMILELAPNFILTSNYTSFVFDGAASPIGLYNGGSQALFNQYISKVNLVQVQAQFNGGPDIGTVFDYDGDNTMTVDNIKVVELAKGIAPLSIVNSNGVIKVYWSDPINSDGTAKLQSATNVTGPYTDVAGADSGAASPYTVPAGSPAKFFRAKWVSP